jgi:hypothetical protein
MDVLDRLEQARMLLDRSPLQLRATLGCPSSSSSRLARGLVRMARSARGLQVVLLVVVALAAVVDLGRVTDASWPVDLARVLVALEHTRSSSWPVSW